MSALGQKRTTVGHHEVFAYQTLIASKPVVIPTSLFTRAKLALGGRPGSVVLCGISTAPFDLELELAVINANGVRAIAFPCRRILGGWIKAESKTRLDVRPTHWRDWAKCSANVRFRG
jgi:hypothetical protein